MPAVVSARTGSAFCLPRPNPRVTEDEMIQILEQYEISASQKCRDYNLAAWNYNTDVENANKVEDLVSTSRMTSVPSIRTFITFVRLRLKGALRGSMNTSSKS